MKIVTLSAAVAATGTYTVVLYTALAGKVATVNSIALTEGVHWTAATSNAATATSLAAAITTATATTLCTAVAVGAVVTVTAVTAGTAGNSLTLATTDATNLTKSATTLLGGVDAGTNGTLVFTGPGRIKTISIYSLGVGNLGVTVRNGLTIAATEYDYITGTDSETIIRTYTKGMVLPAGCFISMEKNVQTVTIEYAMI